MTGAPGPADPCRAGFTTDTTPAAWPPPDDANGKVLPTPFPCQSQRPSWNIAPAIGADGTIFTVSRGHAAENVAFVVAVNPDLTTKWVRPLSYVFTDGCGSVNFPYQPNPDDRSGCRLGTAPGIDRSTNAYPSGLAVDESSSSPVALPDGSVLNGSDTSYNGERGHLVKIDAAGELVATFDFGWDVTPAVWRHDGTYSIVLKDNFYFGENGGMPAFYLRQLDANLQSQRQLSSRLRVVRQCAGHRQGRRRLRQQRGWPPVRHPPGAATPTPCSSEASSSTRPCRRPTRRWPWMPRGAHLRAEQWDALCHRAVTPVALTAAPDRARCVHI